MEILRQKGNLKGLSNSGAFNIFIVAFLMAACCFVPYIITGRGYFLFYGDFNVQQIPFYQLCHDAIRNGEWGWSFSTDLGANFIGSYSFYLLGSPFFWLTIPFPNSFLPYLMGPLLILKFSFAALCAYLYIRRFTKKVLTAQLGGILYAFSGFSIYNIFFNHFHEPLIFFPLLLLAFELLVTENKRGLFAIMICVCAITNYFFFFGMLVFGIIYMFFRFLSKEVNFSLKKLFVIIFEALLGIALACVILVPSYLAISTSDRIDNISLGWNSILYGKESIYANIIEVFFFPPDLPARPVMFPNADVKWSSLGGWLPVFSMVGVFAYCQGKKGNWIKRILITCTVMALVPILNSAFYAFNNAYYARWFFMPILIMCLATALSIEDSQIDFKKPFLQVFGITLGITIVIGLFPQNSKDNITIGLFSDNTSLTFILRFWVTCFIALCGLVVLGFLLKLRKENLQRFLKLALVTVAVFSIGYANFFIAGGKTHSYSNKVMIDNLIESNLTLEGDKDTYRIDTYKCVDNTAMFLNYSSINCFHSIVPSTITEFYKFIDGERVVASRPETELYAIRPLLSVKYLLNRENGDKFEDENGSAKMSGYKYLETQQGHKIYENENFIGYGFSYDHYMNYTLCEKYNGNDRAKMMLKAILLTDEQIEKYGYMFENLADENYIVLSYEQMEKDVKQRAQTSAFEFKTNKNSFSATVNRDKDNLVFFSIPYEKGWTAYVNGQETEIEKVNVGFMAVKVPKGTSQIEFVYETPGLKIGAMVSGIAVVLLVVYIAAFCKRDKWL